jgi:hypothetical protein
MTEHNNPSASEIARYAREHSITITQATHELGWKALTPEEIEHRCAELSGPADPPAGYFER